MVSGQEKQIWEIEVMGLAQNEASAPLPACIPSLNLLPEVSAGARVRGLGSQHMDICPQATEHTPEQIIS